MQCTLMQLGYTNYNVRLFQVVLRKGAFPPSVQTLSIYGARRLRVEEGAVRELTSLSRLEMRRIGTLTVHGDGLSLPSNASLAFIAIDNVESMTIESHAFSGQWDTGAKIKITYVRQLNVKENAFSFRSPVQAPSIIVEQSNWPDIDAMAFNGTFREMALSAIATKMCRRNAFSGEIRDLSMDRVNISEVREGCITGSGTLHRLSITNSRLGVIRHRGISGNITSVNIMDSSIVLVQPNGVQLNASTLDIKRSNFSSIMVRGLNVLADKIYLAKLTVDRLDSHALKAVKVAANGSEKKDRFGIYSLTVKNAGRASLAFDNATAVQLVRLSVGVPEPAVCPVDRWVRQLTGAGETDPLDATQRLILKMLQRDWLCRPDQPAPSAAPGADSEDSGAPGAERGDPGADRGGTVATDADNLLSSRTNDEEHSYDDIVEGIVVAVILLGAGLLVGTFVLKRRNRETKSSENEVTRTTPASDSKEYRQIRIEPDGLRQRKVRPTERQSQASHDDDKEDETSGLRRRM